MTEVQVLPGNSFDYFVCSGPDDEDGAAMSLTFFRFQSLLCLHTHLKILLRTLCSLLID